MGSLMIYKPGKSASIHRDCRNYDHKCRTKSGFRACRMNKKNCMSPFNKT